LLPDQKQTLLALQRVRLAARLRIKLWTRSHRQGQSAQLLRVLLPQLRAERRSCHSMCSPVLSTGKRALCACGRGKQMGSEPSVLSAAIAGRRGARATTGATGSTGRRCARATAVATGPSTRANRATRTTANNVRASTSAANTARYNRHADRGSDSESRQPGTRTRATGTSTTATANKLAGGQFQRCFSSCSSDAKLRCCSPISCSTDAEFRFWGDSRNDGRSAAAAIMDAGTASAISQQSFPSWSSAQWQTLASAMSGVKCSTHWPITGITHDQGARTKLQLQGGIEQTSL